MALIIRLTWPNLFAKAQAADQCGVAFVIFTSQVGKQSRPLADDEIDFDPVEADSIAIQRFASKRRGNWWQLPADLKNEDDLN